MRVPQPSAVDRPSVISPRIPVGQSSLDWDNYSESPSYNPGSQVVETQQLNISSCIREIQGITGLEEVPKITLVSTSVSSLCADSLSLLQPEVNQSVPIMSSQQSEARVLENMKLCVEEMMEDFTAGDVRRANFEEIPKVLEEITKARTEFRNKVREYKQSYTLASSSIQLLDTSISTLNQQVRNHAHSIWAKMEELQLGPSTVTPPIQPSVTPSQVSNNRDDLDYKKRIYKDQLLYLTEALSLPDDDG